MASFLRRKNKQDSPTKPADPVSLPGSIPPPPLFARFATTAQNGGQKDGMGSRMVSSPIMLNSQRKDVPQRGLSTGRGQGYAWAADVRNDEMAHNRRVTEPPQSPSVPTKNINYDLPSPQRPKSKLFVDKPLPPPSPEASASFSMTAINPSRRTSSSRATGPLPPSTFQTQQINQGTRTRASFDSHIGDTERIQQIQRPGSSQAQYLPYKFAPTPPAKGNGSISKPPMAASGPPSTFNRQYLTTTDESNNLATPVQTLSPRQNYAALDGVNGIVAVGDVPSNRMSLLGSQHQQQARMQDGQGTPMSDRGIDLPPEFALFQDYNETISIPSAPNSLNSRRPPQSASGNTVNAKVTEQVSNSNIPRSNVHLISDAHSQSPPSHPPRPQSQYQQSPNFSFISNPQPDTLNTRLPSEMGTAASRILGSDVLSSSTYKDISAPRIVPPSNRAPSLNSSNVANAATTQIQRPQQQEQQSIRLNSRSLSPAHGAAQSANPHQQNMNRSHLRNASQTYYPQPPQSQSQPSRSQFPSTQTPPSVTLPPPPPPPPSSSSYQLHPAQSAPAPLRKISSLQIANAPTRGKPRIFAAMEAQENDIATQVAANSDAVIFPSMASQEVLFDSRYTAPKVAIRHQQSPPQPRQPAQSSLLPPAEFSTPKSRFEDLPNQSMNSTDPRPSSSSSTSLLSSSPSRVPVAGPDHLTSQHIDPLLRTSQSTSSRPLSRPEEPHQQLISSQATPRTRKLSKARTHVDNASINSQSNESTSIVPGTPESHRLHSRASHRSIGKSNTSRPITPNKHSQAQGKPIVHLDDDSTSVGVPLDEDPFARAEGVKMLRPTTPPPPQREGTVTKQRVKSSINEVGNTTEDEHSQLMATQNENKISTPLTPVSPESRKKSKKEHSKNKKMNSTTTRVADEETVADEQPPRDPITLVQLLADPQLLSTLLSFMTFYDWCLLSSISKEIRIMLVRSAVLREAVLESYLKTVGYTKWAWDDPEPLSLSLQDLNDYMRGVSTPNHEYSRVASMYVHSLTIHPNHRDPSLAETVHALTASTRAYNRVLLRLRAQAEKEASIQSLNNSHPHSASSYKAPRNGTSSRVSSRAPSPTTSMNSHFHHGGVQSPGTIQQASLHQTGLTFRSPLFRLRRAPLLRVFVPSPEGDWLSDKSVLECEAECKRAGITHLLRLGDVVWDVAVGDEGNIGRLVWDGSYLIDLDYTYSPVGDLPKYLPTLAFPPSYFHRVLRTGPNITNPIAHIDISPWGEEIAMNLQLLQDRVRTETPQGAYHNVVRWVHRSSFSVRPSKGRYNTPPRPGQQTSGRISIPDSNNLYVDSGWYGTIVVETEGTNEALADLQDRCGPGAFPPRPRGLHGQISQAQIENRKVFRILREKSRPGEIWIRAVNVKERLL